MESPLLIWDFYSEKYQDEEIKEVLKYMNDESKIELIVNNGPTRPVHYIAVLLYKAMTYAKGEFWISNPSIKDIRLQQKYFEIFEKFIERKKLFKPDIKAGNWKVNTILVHIFIPPKYVNQFLDFVYSLYIENEGNYEKIKELKQEDLKNLIVNRNMLRVFQIITEYKETTNKLKNIISNIFAIWNGENITVSFPYWLYEQVTNFIEIKNTFKRSSKVLSFINGKYTLNPRYSNSSLIFLDSDYRKIWFEEEDKKLLISKEPSYVLLDKKKVEELNVDKDKNFIYKEQIDGKFFIFHVYDYPDIKDILETLLEKEVDIIPEGKYISLEGEEVEEFIPIDRNVKIYKDYFKIHIEKPNDIRNLIIKLPNGEKISLKNFNKNIEVFYYPGVYEIIYSTPLRQNIKRKVVILNKENIPILDYKNQYIKYEGRFFSYEEKIKIFDSISVKFNIPSEFQVNFINGTTLRLTLKIHKLWKNLSLNIYNKCNFKIDKIPVKNREQEINLDNYKPFLTRVIKLTLSIENFEIINKIIKLSIKKEKPCPYVYLSEKRLSIGNTNFKIISDYKFVYKYDKIKRNSFISILERYLKRNFSTKEELENFINSKKGIEVLWKLFHNKRDLLNKFLYLEEKK